MMTGVTTGVYAGLEDMKRVLLKQLVIFNPRLDKHSDYPL
jgi:hypothetical protein